MWQGILQRLYPASLIPEKWRKLPIVDIPLLAIDMELTGLDPGVADITSIAWVSGLANCIDLSSSVYEVVFTDTSLGQSPVIHGLGAEHIAAGAELKPLLQELLAMAASHVWVFHNTSLDMAIIRRACRVYQLPFPVIVSIDTLQLALYQLAKEHQILPANSATLGTCRQRLSLPRAPEHNALDDAFATLQLCFAQLHEMDPQQALTLTNAMHTGAVKVSTI
jgi:DNA polymerase III subunit epsilon